MRRKDAGKIFLRDFLPSDLLAVQEYSGSAAVVQWQDWGPNTLEQTRDFVDSCIRESHELPRSSYNLAIIEKAGGQLVGGCALFVRNPGVEAEIGFSLNPIFWGQGFATQAGRLLLELAFADLGIPRVFATCRPQNLGSISVLKKLGLKEEGRIPDHKSIRGTLYDSLVFSTYKWDGSSGLLRKSNQIL